MQSDPRALQRFCVAKKIGTLTTERNKTALAVPKQSNLFIGTWELQISSKQKVYNPVIYNMQEHDNVLPILPKSIVQLT